jgi:AcrR family transcriptional regulator
MSDETKTRRYRKRKRAEQEEETRQRITEVAVELHRTIGPARTRVTDIAERAGVSRMTVYNHFPTDADLFGACSSHWFARHPFPDLEAWIAVSDPGERLRVGLAGIYSWYRQAQDMMGRALRDAPIVPAVGEIMAAWWWPFVDQMVDVLSVGWPDAATLDDLRVALRLLVDFRTWEVLARSGLDDARAAALASRMIACVPSPHSSDR